jgi:hypothetical protein
MADGETLAAICEAPGMPHANTVRGWAVHDVDGFSVVFARAREAQAHAIAEKALIGAQTDEDAQLGRLRFDARRWFASKMLPKTYGEKTTTEHTGSGGGAIVWKWGDGSE